MKLLCMSAGRGKNLLKPLGLGLRYLSLQELNCGCAGTRLLSLGAGEQPASSPKPCLWRQQCTVQGTQPQEDLFNLYFWISFGDLRLNTSELINDH